MESSLRAQIEAARAYETLMVPALFGEWAPRVAQTAQLKPGDRVLDVACGTGVLAREAAARVAPAGEVSAVDASPGMLRVAERMAPGVTFKQGLAESLPFGPESFDALVSQFGLMFFSDRKAAIREALRVLVPGGRLAFAVWDSIENNAAYADEVAIVERIAGPQASDALRAPFALGDSAALSALFRDAGVAGAAVSTHRGTGRFPSIRVLVEADLRGWLPLVGIVLPEDRIARILAQAENVLRSYLTSDGSAAFDTSVLIVAASKG
jgi:SAM-dependent methyltransferase